MDSIIKNNYDYLCNNTEVNNELLVKLLDSGYIVRSKKESISKMDNEISKASEIYDTLRRNIPDSQIENVKNILKATGNFNAWDVFENPKKFKTEINEDKYLVPRDVRDAVPVEAIRINLNDENTREIPGEIHKVLVPYTNEGKLKALIINVVDDREGAIYDSKELDSTLKGCGFEVKHCENLTTEGIKDCISEFKSCLEELENPNGEGVGACLIAVMSHGTGYDWFKTHDGPDLSLDKHVIEQFNNKNFFQNTKKPIPKIFLFNVCRGKEQDGPSIQTDFAGSSNKSFLDAMVKQPTYSDMLVSYASYDGHVAYRETLKGTWYVQTFCEVVQKYADGRTDICDILTVVFKMISKKETSDGCKQTSPYYNIGFSKFYLKRK